jgi:hypothetical protein
MLQAPASMHFATFPSCIALTILLCGHSYTRTIIIIINTIITMNASQLFLLTILSALGGSVVFDVPAVITALIIGIITIFAYACYLFTVTMDRHFMSPVEKRRKSSHKKEGSMLGRYIVRSIDQRADDTFMFLRKMLTLFFFGLFGMIQVATGCVAPNPLCLALHYLVTLIVSLSVAQYMAETIWNWCAVVIHAVASTVQSVIFGPICFAFEVATNALFAVLKGIFKIVKSILLELFRAFFMAFRTATIFVLRALFGFFFPSLREAQDGADVEYEAGHGAYDTATADYYDTDYESDTDSDSHYGYESEGDCDYESDDDYFYKTHDHVATPATLRFLAPLHRQGRVDYRSY